MANYETTFQDFKDAQRLYVNHRPWARVRLYLALYGFGAAGFLLLLWALYGRMQGDKGIWQQLRPAVVWLLFMAASLPFLRWYNIRKTYKRLMPDETLDSIPTTFTFGDEGFLSSLPGRSEGRFFWNALVDYAEDERLALIFVRKKVFLYLPKRALSSEEWTELREYIQKQLGRI